MHSKQHLKYTSVQVNGRVPNRTAFRPEVLLEQQQFRNPSASFPTMGIGSGMGMGGMGMNMGMMHPMGMNPMNMPAMAMGPMGMPMPLMPGAVLHCHTHP